jgi:hypothetical protein
MNIGIWRVAIFVHNDWDSRQIGSPCYVYIIHLRAVGCLQIKSHEGIQSIKFPDYLGLEGFNTSGAGTGITVLMQLGVAFELETPKVIVRQILKKRLL